jgi:hypothetical protein
MKFGFDRAYLAGFSAVVVRAFLSNVDATLFPNVDLTIARSVRICQVLPQVSGLPGL